MPYRFSPIAPNTSTQQLIAVINNNFAQLDNESVSKVFKQASGNAIINGKLPYDGGYGSLFYDKNGVPNIIIGILPNGETGIVVANPGVDVINGLDW